MSEEQKPPLDSGVSAAATLQNLSHALIRKATETLGWRVPSQETTRDGAASNYQVTALHQYGRKLAMLSIRVGSEPPSPLDLRVTCELADNELFNAGRIVHESGVADESVRQWLEQQLERCLATLASRTRGI